MISRVTGLTSTSTPSTPSGGGQIFTARVTQIILDDKTNPEVFKANGEWSSIGTIIFAMGATPTQISDPWSGLKAKPLSPNTKHYPLINELVYVMSLPNSDNAEKPNSQ